MKVYSMLNTIISITPYLMLYWFVYKKWFRFNVGLSIFLFAVMYAFEYGYLSRSGIGGEGRAWFYLILFVANLLLFQKEMITRAMIVEVFFDFLYNVMGGIVMVILTSGYGMLTGADNQTWFATGHNTPVEYLFRYLMMPVTGAISCYITYKLLPLLEKLHNKEHLWMALGLTVPMVCFEFFKRWSIKSVEDYYGGIVVICYGLLMFVVGMTCVLCVLITTIRVRAERKEIQFKMELQREQYEEIRVLQQGVRELRHDIVNHLAAGTLSEESVKRLVQNCRKAVKEI